jgi:hypothetical protein
MPKNFPALVSRASSEVSGFQRNKVSSTSKIFHHKTCHNTAASEEPQPLRVGVGLNMWSLDFLIGHHGLDYIVCG